MSEPAQITPSLLVFLATVVCVCMGVTACSVVMLIDRRLSSLNHKLHRIESATRRLAQTVAPGTEAEDEKEMA